MATTKCMAEDKKPTGRGQTRDNENIGGREIGEGGGAVGGWVNRNMGVIGQGAKKDLWDVYIEAKSRSEAGPLRNSRAINQADNADNNMADRHRMT